MIPQEQDHGNVPVFLSGILKINPRSLSLWGPGLGSGRGEEETFRVLLLGKYTWFLSAKAREVSAAQRTMGVPKQLEEARGSKKNVPTT